MSGEVSGDGVIVTPTERSPTGYEVTFRYWAPDAEAVGLVGDAYFTSPDAITRTLGHDARLGDDWRPGDVSHPLVSQPPAALELQPDGWWELATAMPAGTYSYGFVEGECERAALCRGHLDPTNPPPFAGEEGAGHQRTSQVYVPSDSEHPTYDVGYESDAAEGERGRLEHHTYASALSTAPEGERALGVYLPSGYDPDRPEPYPLLVLSHGMGENETAWFADGRAAQILDHAIADGDIPAIVAVTTDFGGLTDEPTGSAAFHAAYVDELTTGVLPYVESAFHVSSERDHRAFGGLSMGGALAVGLLERHPELFAWYGIWSAAPVPEGWHGLDAQARRAVRQAAGIHVGVGVDDGIVGIADSSPERAAAYREAGGRVTETNVPGAHTWQVWRAELHAFLTTTAFAQ